jgi:SagB-type dehydrogenase family enzyme
MPELRDSLGFKYLQDTKFDRQGVLGQPRPKIEPERGGKVYSKARQIRLPEFEPLRAELGQVLAERRSRRGYASNGLALEELAALVWAAQGTIGSQGRTWPRTAPSAGALYPFETYLVLKGVSGLDDGIYHLSVRGLALEELALGDYNHQTAEACLDQGFVAQAAVVFIWSAVLRRNMAKYGHRGLRYICMDLGHVCQNVLLAAQALGLSGCPIAALYDDELNAMLGLDGTEESALYAASLGRPATP